MNEWLYQFWLFAFKSAKHWGTGPRHWTASGLRFDAFEANIPNTPRSSSSAYDAFSYSISSPFPNEYFSYPEPSQLCNWAIHEDMSKAYSEAAGNSISSTCTAASEQAEQDPHDERTWISWHDSWKEPSFIERIRDALEHNDFSTLKSDQLPVAIPQVAKEAERSPNEMFLEALRFAIMGRNVELVEDLYTEAICSDLDMWSCYPLHLAASYLDGSTACCTVLKSLWGKLTIFIEESITVDDVGHTVMDKLLLVILKSHTTVLPSVVDPTNHESRFPGDETDICGRWDADSDCYRSLLCRGFPAAPAEWKHKFCHTSANAICHAITFATSRLDESGLFVRLCTCCGVKLTMSHLHALVLVAFHLAMSGFEDEDLFGILACALQILDSDADPRVRNPVSLELLNIRQSESMGTCTHEDLTPAELAQRLGSYKLSSWSKKVTTGWEILCWVLWRSQEMWLPMDIHNVDVLDSDSDSSDSDSDSSDFEYGFSGFGYGFSYFENDFEDTTCSGGGNFRRDPTLATLWAAVQTELLTYRRVNVGDPWISDHFNMEELLRGLKEAGSVSVGLVENGLMKAHCRCGSFAAKGVVCTDDVSAADFSNMDIWSRATYLSASDW